jgi:predicted metal-binding membrane protein
MKDDLREICGAPAPAAAASLSFARCKNHVEFVPKLFKASEGSNFDPTRQRLWSEAIKVRTQAWLAASAKGPLPTLIAVDLAGWVVLANSHFSLLMPDFCSSLPGDWMAQGSAGVVAALILNPPAQLIMSCLIMLVAMMTPLLARPIAHLWNHSPARLRAPAIALFVATYAGVWLLAGCVLMAIAVALKAFASAAALPIPALAVVIALIWQATPAKQTCLNRCHRLHRLSAFCSAAVWDCVRCGAMTALWCVGACWALMLVPLVLDEMHFATMAGVAAVLFVERQARATRWRPEMIGDFGREPFVHDPTEDPAL